MVFSGLCKNGVRRERRVILDGGLLLRPMGVVDHLCGAHQGKNEITSQVSPFFPPLPFSHPEAESHIQLLTEQGFFSCPIRTLLHFLPRDQVDRQIPFFHVYVRRGSLATGQRQTLGEMDSVFLSAKKVSFQFHPFVRIIWRWTCRSNKFPLSYP